MNYCFAGEWTLLRLCKHVKLKLTGKARICSVHSLTQIKQLSDINKSPITKGSISKYPYFNAKVTLTEIEVCTYNILHQQYTFPGIFYWIKSAFLFFNYYISNLDLKTFGLYFYYCTLSLKGMNQVSHVIKNSILWH